MWNGEHPVERDLRVLAYPGIDNSLVEKFPVHKMRHCLKGRRMTNPAHRWPRADRRIEAEYRLVSHPSLEALYEINHPTSIRNS